VPQVLALHDRLTKQFAEPGPSQPLQFMHLDARREGKTLAGPVPAGAAASQPEPRPKR
jgi:hypothetical protein